MRVMEGVERKVAFFLHCVIAAPIRHDRVPELVHADREHPQYGDDDENFHELFYGDDDVILFAFAQKQMLAEKQIV